MSAGFSSISCASSWSIGHWAALVHSDVVIQLQFHIVKSYPRLVPQLPGTNLFVYCMVFEKEVVEVC